MKTKITQLNIACLALVMAAAFIVAAMPAAMPAAMAQPPGDDVWSIQFVGLSTDHEGAAGWNSDGTGPEPAHTGHQIPFPGWTHQFYTPDGLQGIYRRPAIGEDGPFVTWK